MTRARDVANLIGSGNYSSTTFTATAGQTAFTIAHTQGFVQVFMNGLLLDETVDWTSDGSAVTLTSGAAAGDEIEVVAYNTFSVGDALNQAAADTRYVNASGDTMTGNLGIGAAPSFSTLEVTADKTTANNLQLTLRGSTNTNKQMIMGFDTTDDKSFITSQIAGTAQKPLVINSSGVTMPSQPCFIATRDSNYVIGTTEAVIPIDNEDLDVGNNYNTSTYSFTAPIAGNYLFAFQGTLNSINAGTYNAIYLRKNGAGTGYRFRTLTGSGWTGINGSCIIALAANDYVNMYGYVQSGSMTLQGSEIHFMGYLIG